jgi:hypothetical protein
MSEQVGPPGTGKLACMQRLNREQEASILWSLRHEAHLPGSLVNSVEQLQREIGLGRRALIVTATSTFKFVLAGTLSTCVASKSSLLLTSPLCCCCLLLRSIPRATYVSCCLCAVLNDDLTSSPLYSEFGSWFSIRSVLERYGTSLFCRSAGRALILLLQLAGAELYTERHPDKFGTPSHARNDRADSVPLTGSQ